jgi:hypothetical protein
MSTLSAIFPKSLVNNIAFVFTNVPSPLSCHLNEDTLPDVLRGVPRFLLDNPVGLQKKYLELKNNLNRRRGKEMCRAVRAGEEKALEMLVDLFDWLDGLESHPTTRLVSQDHQKRGKGSLGTMERKFGALNTAEHALKERVGISAMVKAFFVP